MPLRDRQGKEREIAELELRSLANTLPTHFLFNAMQSISALMYSDVRAADAMMTRLSDLLRLTLRQHGIHETSLQQEIQTLDLYLKVEKLRFQNRLEVTMNIQSEVLDARVPPLILQPLVENSIRHSMNANVEKGRIYVSAFHDGSSLTLLVRDNGPGFLPKRPKQGSEATGIGLQTTRRRLQLLYGDRQQLSTRNLPEGGAEVHIQIPFVPDEPQAKQNEELEAEIFEVE